VPDRFAEQLSVSSLQTADGFPQDAEDGYAAALHVTPFGPGVGAGLGLGVGDGLGVGVGFDCSRIEMSAVMLAVTFTSSSAASYPFRVARRV
jgi:hypothetical protein